MENIKKLIKDGGWKPIINMKYPHKKHPDNQRERWYTAESDVNFLKTRGGDILFGRVLEGQKGITNFMPLDTPERMAKVIRVLVEGLITISKFTIEIREWDAVEPPTGEARIAKETLQKADEIAGE